MRDFKSDSSVNRIAKNAAYTGFRFGIYALSGIFLIPFLTRNYGMGGYGLIALAGFLTQYVGMISGCVGTAVARYLNVALNQNDWEQANEIFSTALVANLGFICIQLPIFALGLWKLNWLIDFPPEVATDFRILVACNILIFFVNIIKGVIFTPIIAANRLDISERFNIFGEIARVACLFGFISAYGAKLWIIGAVDLGINLAIFSAGVMIYRKLVHNSLVFRRKYITRKWISPVLGMAGWSLLSALGFSLFVKTDVWIINRFVSKEMAGVYAALLVWPNLIKRVGGIVGGLIAPAFIIDFSRGRSERMIESLMMSSQLISYVAALACGVFAASAPEILGLWLGDSYIQYASWIRLLLTLLVFTISGSLIWRIFVTIAKTKYMGLGNLIPGMLNIALSLLFVSMGYGALGVIYGSIISIVFKENILFPFWLSKEIDVSYRKFAFIYLRAGVAYLCILLISRWGLSFCGDVTLWHLGAIGLCATGAMVVLAVLLATNAEKTTVKRLIKNNFSRG